MVLSTFRFSSPVLAILFWQACPLFPVLDVLSWLSSLAVLSQLSCPGCSVLAIASQPSCPSCSAPAALPQQSCPLLSWRCYPGLACPLCSAQAHLSRISCKADLSTLTSPKCPVSMVLSHMPYQGCSAMVVPFPLPCPISSVLIHDLAILSSVPFLAVLSGLSSLAVLSVLLFLSECPVPAVLLYRSCPQLICPQLTHPHSLVFHVISWHPVLSVLSWLTRTCPGWPVRPTCSDWLVQAVLSSVIVDVMPQLYCHGCPATVVPISVVLSYLSRPSVFFWPSCPLFLVLPVHHHGCLLWLSCPGGPAQAILSLLLCRNILVPSSFVLAVLYSLSCSHCPVLSVLSYMPCPT